VADGFQSLRRGNALLLDLTDGSRGYRADLHLSGAKEPTIIVDGENKARLSLTLGGGLSRPEADQLFTTTANDLRALCPTSATDVRKSSNGQVGYETIRMPDFSLDAEVSLTLLELKESGTSQVDISITPKGKN
jgi:hypothetical protein